MDILLLNLANLIGEQGKEREYHIKQFAVPPLGLLYLGQILNEHGYSVKVYDQTVTGINNIELLKLIKKLNPRIVGFSVLIDNLWTTIDLHKKLKNWNPNIITVAGNYFATFFPEQLLKLVNFDFCVRGESEYILLNLVEVLFKKKKNLNEIKGLTYRENNTIKSTPPAEKVEDLNILPFPDRKLIDFNYRLQSKSTSLLSSRGCPFNCLFCSFSAVMGKTWRPRSVNNVIEELQLVKEQGYKDILFVDDNFTLNQKRIFQLCAEIKRNKLDDLNFSGDCRIDNVSFNLMRALVSINCRKVTFGIESGNQGTLNYYQKGITIEQIRQAIKTAKKARMDIIYGSFIVGAPGETISECINTIKFANALGLSFTIVQILETLPISPIYKELVKKRHYQPTPNDWQKSFNVPDICPTAVPTNVLLKIIAEGFVRFLNKNYLMKLIFNTLVNDYNLNVLIHSIKNIRKGAI
ncbi:MAG: B12-binding domain-containing radical SAM protein [Candidatus Helarchaeota archaeon]